MRAHFLLSFLSMWFITYFDFFKYEMPLVRRNGRIMDINVLPQRERWGGQGAAPGKYAESNEAFDRVYAKQYAGRAEELEQYAGGAEELEQYAGGAERFEQYAGRAEELEQYAGRAEELEQYAGGAEEHDRYAGVTDDRMESKTVEEQERFDLLSGGPQVCEMRSVTTQCPVIGGLGIVGSGAGMAVYYAAYAKDSTADNPIVEIHMSWDATGSSRVYRIPVNEVDPCNASQMEMYAYGVHMDYQNGETKESLTGSCYAMWQAGLFGGEDVTAEEFCGKKKNWLTAVEQIKAHIEEGLKKIQNGEVEEKILIGGLRLTQREWDQLLGAFDKLLDAMDEATEEEAEAMQEKLAGPEAGKYLREHKAAEIAGTTPDVLEGRDALDLLLAETTRAYVASERANEADKMHIVSYTREGIYCREAGQTQGFVWFVPFSRESQYEKVLTFVRGLVDEEDVGFTADQSFWTDFLGEEHPQ